MRPGDIQYETSESYTLNVTELKDNGSSPSSPNNPLSIESFNNFFIPTLKIKNSMDPFYKSIIASDNGLEEEDEKEETYSDGDDQLFVSDIVDVDLKDDDIHYSQIQIEISWINQKQ